MCVLTNSRLWASGNRTMAAALAAVTVDSPCVINLVHSSLRARLFTSPLGEYHNHFAHFTLFPPLPASSPGPVCFKVSANRISALGRRLHDAQKSCKVKSFKKYRFGVRANESCKVERARLRRISGGRLPVRATTTSVCAMATANQGRPARFIIDWPMGEALAYSVSTKLRPLPQRW